MDAIILAAGKGTRLLPHTKTIPKPLLLVQERPILDWIISALPPVEKLIVVVNYLGDQIEHYLEGQKHVRDWAVVWQTEPRGTGDALMSCRGAVSTDSIIVLNGDDLIGKADLAKLARTPAGILAHWVDEPSSYGIINRKPDGTLASLIEKPVGLSAPQLANIGGYHFPRSVFDLTLTLSPRNELEITDAVAQLAERDRFEVVEAGYWLPIGTIAQWESAQNADLGLVATS